VTLELLHPAGVVERVLVLGERCPPSLLPPAAPTAETEVDLALIAPSAAQLRQRGWLRRACDQAVGALRDEGLVYALVPRGRRGAARRRLRAAGLVVDAPLAQLPGREAPRYLVPLDATVWRHTLAHVITARPFARRALVAARALPFGEALLATTLPGVATVARRPGDAGAGAWVAVLGGEPRSTARLVLATSWRGPRGPVVLYPFGDGPREPWGVVKVGPDCSREAGLLERLGSSAQAAGARVPRLLGAGDVGGTPALAETILDGDPAAELLGRSPVRFDAIAGAVAGWLERWQSATARPTRIAAGLIEGELLAPLAELEGELPDAGAYRDWLAARCAAIAGSEIPLVATHNDLTMWNVLVDRAGSIGVLDWAEAQDAGLPLTDFYYAIADAAAACDGYRDRLTAVRDCFTPEGRRAGDVAPLQDRVREALRLGPETAELAFHACWLHHAANEQRTGGDGSFLEIVRWLARRAAEAE
jgi:hypothetical protein